jgi:hypothetical protein
MPEMKLYAPTYNHGEFRTGELPDDVAEFGDPQVPVVVRDADGIRIVLGSHDYWAKDVPDVQIERRPGGWAIFLHPVGGSDASGYAYFLDNGLSYLVPETGYGATPQIMMLRDDEALRHLDEPGYDGPKPTFEPCELCGAPSQEDRDDWAELCPSCGELVRKYLDLKGLPITERRTAIAFLKLDPERLPPTPASSTTKSRRTMAFKGYRNR